MKIVKMLCVAALVGFAASEAFGGWASEGDKKKYANCPMECATLKGKYNFYGDRLGEEIWMCCDVEPVGFAYVIAGDVEAETFDDIASVIGFGLFDDKLSKALWLEGFLIEEEDPYTGEIVEVYEEGYDGALLALSWQTIWAMNAESCRAAIAEFDANCIAYAQGVQTESAGGGDSGGISKEDAENIEAIQEATEATKESIEESKEKIQKEIPEIQEDLRLKQIELARYSDERAKAAKDAISEALNHLDLSVAKLDNAIANNDFDALDAVNGGLDAMLQQLNTAMQQIEGLEGDGYAETRTAIQNATTVISGAKINIQKAKDERNMNHARIARSSLSGLNRLEAARRAISHAIIMGKKARGDAKLKEIDLALTMALLDQYELLLGDIKKLRANFAAFIQRYVTDMNQIGAYLGSTNAMEYFATQRKADAMSADDFARWFRFSAPEKLKRSPPFYSNFRIGGRDWYTVLHNLQSQMFVQAEPIDGLERVREHFNMPSAREDDFRGFYELDDYVPGETGHITNWYANRITAPKNWADGSTVVVTNGRFKANFPVAPALKFVGTTGGGSHVIGGPSSKTNTVTFVSAADSNVKVTVSGDNSESVTVTIGVYYK